MDKRVFDTHLRKTLKIVIPNCDGILLNTTQIYQIASSIIAPRREKFCTKHFPADCGILFV